MSSRFLERLAFSIVALAVAATEEACARPGTAHPARELRVCADPNNLPFSNRKLEGLENRLAEIVARDLGATVRYTWWAQRRGFFRSTLKAGLCDAVFGVPSSLEMVATTRPYYRSTYVFVSRADRNLHLHSFDDAALRGLKIGVPVAGDDGANMPPVHALASRGIVGNVRGYSLYGDYSLPNPPARILADVASGGIDVAIVWGPLAGYFAPKQSIPLVVVPVEPQIDLPFLPFVYDIAVGVRRGDEKLRREIDAVLEKRRPEIENLLREYGVPRPASTGRMNA